MSREEIDLENVPKYKNSVVQDLEAWKQLQHKIDISFRKVSLASFEKYQNQLQEKNTYYNNTKIPEINSKDIADDKMRSIKKFSGAITETKDEGYCQKCPSGKNHCPHKIKKEQIKDKFEYPITSSSAYGWFPFYDNLGDNHNINSETKSFYDQTHL